jgi:hypothetical protein
LPDDVFSYQNSQFKKKEGLGVEIFGIFRSFSVLLRIFGMFKYVLLVYSLPQVLVYCAKKIWPTGTKLQSKSVPILFAPFKECIRKKVEQKCEN